MAPTAMPSSPQLIMVPYRLSTEAHAWQNKGMLRGAIGTQGKDIREIGEGSEADEHFGLRNSSASKSKRLTVSQERELGRSPRWNAS